LRPARRGGREVLSGLLALALLALLAAHGPLHGYGLRRLLEERLGWSVSESSLYDALKRLERLGLAEGYWVRLPGGAVRKQYRLKPEGCEVLRQSAGILRILADLTSLGGGRCG